VLLLAGLGVELATLFWSHPTAFLLFMFLGGILMVMGMATYLAALLRAGEPAKPLDTGADSVLEARAASKSQVPR